MLTYASTSSPHRRRPAARALKLPGALTAVLAVAAVLPAQALAGTAVATYSQPGETAFVVPQGVNQIHIDAFGGTGGGTSVAGGPGAEVQGDLSVSPRETFFLEVGVGGGPGGFVSSGVAGGEGGGASEVRVCSIQGPACTIPGYGAASSVQTRLLVAAGGGGAGYAQSLGPVEPGPGGPGGLLNGNEQDASGGDSGFGHGGAGASVGAPGVGGTSKYGPSGLEGDTGGVGLGGAGARDGGGGGGAGYHGGGGGAGSASWQDPGGVIHPGIIYGGGGGGSSWVNQDQAGIDLYLPHITSASSAVGGGAARILVSYSDFTAPAVSIQSPTSQQPVGARPTFFGAAGHDRGDQPSVTVSIYQGQAPAGSPVQTFTAPVDAGGHYLAQASPLASGTYAATIAQRDSAGNTGTASVTFAVDAAAPTLKITQPFSGSAGANRMPTFAGTGGTKPKDNPRVGIALYAGGDPTGGTPLTTFSALVSGGKWTASAPNPLGDGVYTVVALQSDDGGTDATSKATFIVDTVNPTASITAPAEGGVYQVGERVAAAYACADGGSSIASCAGSVPAGASLDTGVVGPHAFTVVATDRAGNAVTSTVHYTVLPSSGPGTPTHGRSTPASQASSGLRVLSSHLRVLPGGCSQHPRPRRLRAGACAPAAVVSGLIDPHAAGQALTLSWTDGRGHVTHGSALVRRGGRWSTTLRLPARTRPGSVVVIYAGNGALRAASARRTVAPAR
jgi:hypothetical protein